MGSNGRANQQALLAQIGAEASSCDINVTPVYLSGASLDRNSSTIDKREISDLDPDSSTIRSTYSDPASLW